MGLSWSHILIVLVLFVLLFGRGKISELMGDVAQGIKSFKKGMAEDEEPAKEPAPKVIEHKGGASARATKTASRAKTPRKQKSGGVATSSRLRARLFANPVLGRTSRPCSTSVGRSFSSSPSSRSSWSVPRTCRA